MTIKAIPTVYKGVQMRSKLEAAWAEWLDKHSIRWAYEAEGFDIGGMWYLPDFWLPDQQTILEVKGILDHPSLSKTEALATALGGEWLRPRVVVLIGTAPVGMYSLRFAAVPNRPSRQLVLLYCQQCGQAIFGDNYGSKRCRMCRPGDGIVYDPNPHTGGYRTEDNRDAKDGWHLLALHQRNGDCSLLCGLTPGRRLRRLEQQQAVR